MRTRGLVGVVSVWLLFTAPCWAQAPAAEFPPEAPPAVAPGSAEAPAPSPEPPLVPPPVPVAAPAAVSPPTPPPLQPDRTALVPPPDPNWNIGAGVGFGGGLSDLRSNYLAAVERRLGARSWLLLNLGASYQSQKFPDDTAPDAAHVSTTTTSLSAVLGVRYVFVRGVVDVSGSLGGFAAYRDVEHPLSVQLAAQGSSIGATQNDRTFGVQGSIAAERLLTEAVALRVSLQLVQASYEAGTTEYTNSSGTQKRDASGYSLALFANPSLALYLYF